MSFEIIWDKQTKDFLQKIGKQDARRIIKKVNSITENPLRFLKSLTHIKAHKLRIGDYRVLIEVDKDRDFIHVLFIGHRKNIYKYMKRN